MNAWSDKPSVQRSSNPFKHLSGAVIWLKWKAGTGRPSRAQES